MFHFQSGVPKSEGRPKGSLLALAVNGRGRNFVSLLLDPFGLSLFCLLCACVAGCGTTKSYTATDQLLMSDAVDSTVSKIDFRPLEGKRVFLDTNFLTGAKTVPGIPNPILGPHNLINADYVISTVRQQMIADGCLIEEKKEDADLIAEVRIGALGTDGHSVTYGIPASNMLSAASTAISGVPSLPTFPEISVAKRELKSGAAKVAVFAYDRVTHEAVWQSGIEQANSNARDTWFLGIGPIQQGSIYKSARFAGRKMYGEKADDALTEKDPDQNGVSLKDRYLFARKSDRAKSAAPFANANTPSADTTKVAATPGGNLPTPSPSSPPASASPVSNAGNAPSGNSNKVTQASNSQPVTAKATDLK